MVRWMERLEVQGNGPNTFPGFEELFMNHYTPLVNKNIDRDEL